jgi:hypothetical protein
LGVENKNMQDINIVIQWLKEGKKIRPKQRNMMIQTSAPCIKLTFKDGTSKLSGFSPTSDYYGAGWIEVQANDKDIAKVEIVGYGSDRVYKVEYIYFNPQCNRTLCRLTTGETADYPFDLTDFIYDEFEIVTDVEPLLLTLKEVELKFGRPVRIIG